MSYSGDPSTSNKDLVRFLIGDTTTPEQLSDAEINYLITANGSANAAAIAACYQLATLYAGQVDRTIGQLSISASQRAKQYRELAAQLTGASVRLATPFAGGVSVSDKEARATDSGVTQPVFTREKP